MGTVLSSERWFCVAVNKGEKKGGEQRVWGKKDGELIEQNSENKSDMASGTKVGRCGSDKKVDGVIKKNVRNKKKVKEQKWRTGKRGKIKINIVQ